MRTSFFTETVGTDWEHGLAAGNGTLGALLYGDPARHLITVAHERVVLPTDPIRIAPLLAPDLGRIRALIADGHAQDAADLGVARARDEGYPGLQWTDPLVPSVSVAVRTSDTDVTDYSRDVDIDGDVVAIRWQAAGARRSIEMFVSRVDAVVVCRLCGFGTEPQVSVEPPQNVVLTQAGVKGGNAERTRFIEHDDDGERRLSLRFIADWTPELIGSDATVRVRSTGDDETVVLIGVEPVWSDADAHPAPTPRPPASAAPSFDEMLRAHRDALSHDVASTELSLDAPDVSRSADALLADTSVASSNRLLELQYRVAQHLIASSTGKLPPTLQGVWTGTFDPAWSSDYTMNGNVQSGSIASMLSTGNPRQLRTYLDMLEGFADDFAENAKRLFGTDGYVLPSRCSPTHGKCTHFNEEHCHEFWTAGGAWSALFFLDYVWYTADLDYLAENAYPFAREVEKFYEGFLIRGANDEIVFSPSYSPENTSPTFASQACLNATMDRAALAALLQGLMRASRLLSVDAELNDRRAEWLGALPDYRVAPDGTLAEWLDDGVVEDLGHRTASHLLGTWLEPDADLVSQHAEPIRALIAAKLAWRASGGNREEMAYGLVQLGIAAAAVGSADLALECVDRMSRLYFLPSLCTTTDVGAIFNVDIAGGFPEVINSMLIGSTIDTLTLLPALPERWESGALRDLHARGGVVIDELAWTPTTVRLTGHTIAGSRHVRGDAPFRVRASAGWSLHNGDADSDQPERSLELADGESFVVTGTR